MTQETKAPPTVAELEGKVARLTEQTNQDNRAIVDATNELAKAGKSSSIEAMVEASSAREAAVKSAGKTASQLKTVISAVASTKLAANAGKRADIHDAMRGDKSVVGHANALFSLGAEWVKLEKDSDGDLMVNSGGADIKKTRAPSANGGSRGTASWEVEGQAFTSKELVEAHQDMLSDKIREHFVSGNFRAFSMTREAERIHAKLTSS